MRKAAPFGGGTYPVIFEDGEHGEPALGYRDAAGAFVHGPMPAEYPHRPVTDAEEPCPVCGAVQYEEYFPTEDWRGGRGRKGSDSFVPSPLIVSRLWGIRSRRAGSSALASLINADDDGLREKHGWPPLPEDPDAQRRAPSRGTESSDTTLRTRSTSCWAAIPSSIVRPG